MMKTTYSRFGAAIVLTLALGFGASRVLQGKPVPLGSAIVTFVVGVLLASSIFRQRRIRFAQPEPKSSHRLKASISLSERVLAQKLFNNYCEFWNDPRFRLGRDPPFSRDQVKYQLDEASKTAARIQAYLDQQSSGSFTMRMIGGSARTYMGKQSAPPSDPALFVRQIVHATFQGAREKYSQSSREEIDSLLDEIELLQRSSSFIQRITSLL